MFLLSVTFVEVIEWIGYILAALLCLMFIIVVHEFGHYYDAIQNSTSDYDLAETHSQGDEAMFWAWMLNNSLTGYDADVEKYKELIMPK